MLSNVEKEKLVIDLYYNQRKNVRQIAQEARISFRDIAAIIKKVNDVGSGSGNGIVTMDNQQQQQIGNGSSQCVLMHINTFCYRLNLSETMFEVLSFACINIVKTAMMVVVTV